MIPQVGGFIVPTVKKRIENKHYFTMVKNTHNGLLKGVTRWYINQDYTQT
jgi:hypothetical protein